MSKIQVSYILPTKGRPTFIKKALKNIREYITADDELIIIDGSSEKIIKEIALENKDLVTQYFHAPNTTECYKMNLGILHSTGEIIKPVSDDDYIFPEAIKFATKVLLKNKDIDALQCGGEAYKIEKKNSLQFLFYEKVPQNIVIGKDFSGLLKYNTPHIGLLFKRKIIPIIGLYDNSFIASDIYIMGMMIRSKVKLKYLDICMYKNIIYQHSTQNKHAEMENDRLAMKLILRDLPGIFYEPPHLITSLFGLPPSLKNLGMFILISYCYKALHTKVGRLLFRIVGIFHLFFERYFVSKLQKNTEHFPNHENVIWSKKYW